MNYWNNFIGHLRTILHHKKLVRHYCFKAGLYKQGIMHDWSKYSPTEFIQGVKYYQGGKRSPNYGEKIAKGYSSAWLHHKGRNRHHFEYWIDMAIDPHEGLQGMPMPTRYIIEMFCDRIAASQNYNRDNYDDSFPLAYYEKNKDLPAASGCESIAGETAAYAGRGGRGDNFRLYPQGSGLEAFT